MEPNDKNNDSTFDLVMRALLQFAPAIGVCIVVLVWMWSRP